MEWIIAFFICLVAYIIYKFTADMYKDKIELKTQPFTEKFACLTTLINNHVFYGKGKIYSQNVKSYSLYEEGKNQIIRFDYVGGNLFIDWRYKYFHNEVIYKKTIKENRNYCIPVQIKIADMIIQEMDIVIQNHKKKIDNEKNPDPALIDEMDILEKNEKVTFFNIVNRTPEYGILIDSRDNCSYKTIKIGTQIWMAENLRYAIEDNGLKLNHNFHIYNFFGDKIEEAIVSKEYKDYGCLYGIEALSFICPNGWHIPGDYEWSLLFKNLGGSNIAALKLIPRMIIPKGLNIEDSGFSALAGGYRFLNEFRDINSSGYWWSITSPKGFVPGTAGIFWHIDFNKYTIDSSLGLKSAFCSVRCIKD